MTQFEQFAEELTALCQKYEVEIRSSGMTAEPEICVASNHPNKSDWGDIRYEDGAYKVVYVVNLND